MKIMKKRSGVQGSIKIVVLCVVLVFAVLALRTWYNSSGVKARGLAGGTTFAMHCGACETNYVSTLDELNTLVRKGRYRDAGVEELVDPDSPERTFECPACGKVEAAIKP